MVCPVHGTKYAADGAATFEETKACLSATAEIDEGEKEYGSHQACVGGAETKEDC